MECTVDGVGFEFVSVVLFLVGGGRVSSKFENISLASSTEVTVLVNGNVSSSNLA